MYFQTLELVIALLFIAVRIFQLLVAITAFYGVFIPLRTGAIKLSVTVRAFPLEQQRISFPLGNTGPARL